MEHCWQDNTFGIGYLDAGHGHDFGLSEVALTNAAGNTRTSLESIRLGGVADAGTAGANNNVFPSDPTADFSGVLAACGKACSFLLLLRHSWFSEFRVPPEVKHHVLLELCLAYKKGSRGILRDLHIAVSCEPLRHGWGEHLAHCVGELSLREEGPDGDES